MPLHCRNSWIITFSFSSTHDKQQNKHEKSNQTKIHCSQSFNKPTKQRNGNVTTNNRHRKQDEDAQQPNSFHPVHLISNNEPFCIIANHPTIRSHLDLTCQIMKFPRLKHPEILDIDGGTPSSLSVWLRCYLKPAQASLIWDSKLVAVQPHIGSTFLLQG